MRGTSPRFGAGVALAASAALLAACAQPAERGADSASLSIATGTSGGTYFPVGGAIAEIINRQLEGVDASAEATGASVENTRLVGNGQSDLALVQGDVAYQAFHGEDEFADDPVQMQTLMVFYPNVYHAVSLRSIDDRLGLDCFADVAGHRFSVGAPGSGNELATNLVFESLGLSPETDIARQRYAYAETARALREDQIDAGAWVVGEGHGTLRELEATDPIHLVPLCAEERERVLAEHAFYTEHTISAGTYDSVDQDVPTIALWNLLAVSPEMSQERGYELATVLYENVEFVNQVYEPGSEYLVLDNLLNSPVPLHPGVVQYAQEQGLTVPDELRP